MRKKAASLLALSVLAAAFAGCTMLPPTAESPGAIWRSWKKEWFSDWQKMTDKYFFNYDYDDPFNE